MAVITGYLSLRPAVTDYPSQWTSSLLGGMVTADMSPPGTAIDLGASMAGQGALSSALPVQENSWAITGYPGRSFRDDYYYRVHVNPTLIALGNLLSAQQRNVEVWNAFMDSKLLSGVAEVGTDGISYTAPAAAPTYFAGLESRIYSFLVSTNGSPIIDALYTFNFPAHQPTLAFTGRRVVVWPFMPQTKHRESLEWKTDIIPTFNNEQRLALRPEPRQFFSHDFQLSPRQFSRAKAMATQWAHRVYGLPVWSELTYVGPLSLGATAVLFDTSNADYRDNDIVLLWDSDEAFQAVEISTVAADRVNLKLPLDHAYTAAYVAPMRFSRTLQGMSFDRDAHDIVVAKATFMVTGNKDLAASIGYPVYRTKDVLTDRTVLLGGLNERIYRATDEFDNGSGPVVVDVQDNWVRRTRTVTFDALTRAERWTVRKWIHGRRGRQGSFWLPSWNRDLEILTNVDAASAAITVRPIGYPLYYGVTDIMVQLLSGARIFARVSSGSTDINGNEVLILSAAIGTAFTVAEIDFTCFMSHVRFDTDRIEISHDYAGRASMTIPVTETPE